MYASKQYCKEPVMGTASWHANIRKGTDIMVIENRTKWKRKP